MTDRVPQRGLDAQGISTGAEIHWNLTTAPLVEHAVRRGEGLLAKDGPLAVRTGKHTGRSAQDRFIVREPSSEDKVWWGKVNRAIEPRSFDLLHQRMLNYVKPDFVHVMVDGRIIRSGGPELALELEEKGYEEARETAGA